MAADLTQVVLTFSPQLDSAAPTPTSNQNTEPQITLFLIKLNILQLYY